MVDFSDREADSLEWRGYVRRALESIDQNLVSIDKKIDEVEACVNNMKVKVAAIGGTVSFVVTIIILLLSKTLGG